MTSQNRWLVVSSGALWVAMLSACFDAAPASSPAGDPGDPAGPTVETSSIATPGGQAAAIQITAATTVVVDGNVSAVTRNRRNLNTQPADAEYVS